MDSSNRYPIVIIGAGPVGLSLALGLLRQGFAVIVLEQRSKLASDPRATTIQPPTLEMLWNLGILDELEAKGRRVDHLEYWDWGAKQELLTSLPLHHLDRYTHLPYRVNCAQKDLCEVLLAEIDRMMPGTVQFGRAVTGFLDREHYVEVYIGKGGRRRTLHASWLCAADGSASKTRKTLDIPMVKQPIADTFFTCEIADPMPTVRGRVIADTSWLFTKLGFGLFMRMPDSVRILFLINNDDDKALTARSPALLTQILFGADTPIKFLNRGIYNVHPQVAQSWRKGRVILLGDAVHATFPVSGTAMNAGIRDAYLLSEALPDEPRIATWEQARREEVIDHVNTSALKTYNTLTSDGLFTRMSRNRYLRSLNHNEEQARQHVLGVSMLEGRSPMQERLKPT